MHHPSESVEPRVLELLNHLLAIDLDALDAYEAALGRLENPADREQLTHFVADHRRHVQSLCGMIEAHGGQPCVRGDFTSVLTKGKILIGALLGDQAILRVMRANEDDAAHAYSKAATADLPAACEAIIHQKLEDARRRQGWLVRRLGVLEQVMEP